MTDKELLSRVDELACAFDKLPKNQQLDLQPSVNRVIATLKSRKQPIPAGFGRIAAARDEEEEDFFENMPV